MSPKSDRRATTLSISLTPELAAAVASRVNSGMYTSASELIREALRLLLRGEGQPSVARFAEASEMMDFGLWHHVDKVRQANPELSPTEVRERLDALANEQETGPGLRVAPERLSKLKLDEPG